MISALITTNADVNRDRRWLHFTSSRVMRMAKARDGDAELWHSRGWRLG
jgi:hypothetical protein